MMAPVAAGLKERKAEWEEIEELIDYFSDLYDKVVEMVPEEEDEINYEDEEDNDMSGYHVSSLKPDVLGGSNSENLQEDDPWKSVNEYMSTKHDDVPIISPVYDPSIVTPEDEEVINNYYKEEAKKEQYIPFEEEKQKPTREIKSKGSIL